MKIALLLLPFALVACTSSSPTEFETSTLEDFATALDAAQSAHDLEESGLIVDSAVLEFSREEGPDHALWVEEVLPVPVLTTPFELIARLRQALAGRARVNGTVKWKHVLSGAVDGKDAAHLVEAYRLYLDSKHTSYEHLVQKAPKVRITLLHSLRIRPSE